MKDTTKRTLWRSKISYGSIEGNIYTYKFESEETMEKEGIVFDYNELDLTRNNLIEAILDAQDEPDYSISELKKLKKHELYNIALMMI